MQSFRDCGRRGAGVQSDACAPDVSATIARDRLDALCALRRRTMVLHFVFIALDVAATNTPYGFSEWFMDKGHVCESRYGVGWTRPEPRARSGCKASSLLRSIRRRQSFFDRQSRW